MTAAARKRKAPPAEMDVSRSELRTELQRIADRNDGRIQPQDLIKAARNSKSPLHDYFTWDDGDAAEKWRLAQAGALIRRVKLTIIRKEADDRKVVLTVTREFHSRDSQRGAGYEPIADIMSDEDKRHELLNQALKELSWYRKKYENLQELSVLWEVVDPLLSDD